MQSLYQLESLDVNNLEAGNTLGLGEILQDLQQQHHQTSSPTSASYSSADNSSRSTITIGTFCSWTSPTNTSIRCAI